MVFSDLHINPQTKIEVLPTDRFDKKSDVLVEGDCLFYVFRPVGSPFVAERLSEEFISEFKHHYAQSGFSVSGALTGSLHAFNNSCLCPPSDFVPESGSMALVAYVSPEQALTFAQLGPIALKRRTQDGLVTLTQDHTFGNPDEVERLSKLFIFKENYGTREVGRLLSDIVTAFDFKKLGVPVEGGLPSRFLGHPSWCCWVETENEDGGGLINTRPYIGVSTLLT